MNYRSRLYLLLAVVFIMMVASCSHERSYTIYSCQGELLTENLGKTLNTALRTYFSGFSPDETMNSFSKT